MRFQKWRRKIIILFLIVFACTVKIIFQKRAYSYTVGIRVYKVFKMVFQANIIWGIRFGYAFFMCFRVRGLTCRTATVKFILFNTLVSCSSLTFHRGLDRGQRSFSRLFRVYFVFQFFQIADEVHERPV